MTKYWWKFLQFLDVYQKQILLLMNVAAAVAFGVLFVFVHNQSQVIQDERRQAVIRACLDTNQRYHNTIALIDEQVAKLPPRRQAAAKANRENTAALINALVPLVPDCDALADRIVPSN